MKVDPDTVWFPKRLIPILVEQEQTKSLEAREVWGGHGPPRGKKLLMLRLGVCVRLLGIGKCEKSQIEWSTCIRAVWWIFFFGILMLLWSMEVIGFAIHSWRWLMNSCKNWSSVFVSGLDPSIGNLYWSSIISPIIGQTWGLQSQFEQRLLLPLFLVIFLEVRSIISEQ